MNSPVFSSKDDELNQMMLSSTQTGNTTKATTTTHTTTPSTMMNTCHSQNCSYMLCTGSNPCFSGATKASVITTTTLDLKTLDCSSAAENDEQPGVSIDFETEIANMKAYKRAK